MYLLPHNQHQQFHPIQPVMPDWTVKRILFVPDLVNDGYHVEVIYHNINVCKYIESISKKVKIEDEGRDGGSRVPKLR